jgi:ribosomal protein L40E
MSAFGKKTCPECGAGNGPGAPFCASCGKVLLRLGSFARPVDDDDDEDEDEAPRPAKKPGKAPEGAVQKGAPLKKPVKKPVDDEDEEEEEVRRPPAKKPVKKRAADEDEEDDEEPQSMRENTALNLLAPVGGSVWGLASLAFGVLGAVLPIVLAILYSELWNAHRWLGKFGYAVAGLAIFCSLLAFPLALMSFIMRPKKASYGGVTTYLRAIIGVVAGLLGLALGAVAIWVVYSKT